MYESEKKAHGPISYLLNILVVQEWVPYKGKFTATDNLTDRFLTVHNLMKPYAATKCVFYKVYFEN